MEKSFLTSRTNKRNILIHHPTHRWLTGKIRYIYSKGEINKLDHVVINTNDADGFIKVYKNIFNIRLALDKVIEHWKSRMLFFRVNKTTIEVIEKKDENDSKDSLWGLAWEVDSIEEAYKRLTKEGVEISSIKEGLKENTLVATIKSHTHNVPTLLIEQKS